jgi:16S rRNA (guanine966-N2)-methyltransferase
LKTLRIIAGQRRGHKIESPDDRTTRPTSDMVRESIFNILGPVVEDRPVFDLFAGTGALGLEALSRGAARAVFVEKDRDNLALIRRNVALLRYEDRTHVIGADAYRWAGGLDARDQGPVVVFLDPPYREHERNADRLAALLGSLEAGLAEGSFVVLEAPERLDRAILPDTFQWDIRRYGGTSVCIGERLPQAAEPSGDPARDDAP